MANDLGEAFVRIRPNFAGFQREAEAGLGKSLKHIAEIVGVAYGAKTTFEFVKSAAEDAAAVQKSTEVIKKQFGDAGKSLIEFSEKAGIHLGIAGHESEAVAARFGILFKNLGIGKQTAAEMTLNMEKLGGSIAALRGIDPTTVLDRLPIALAGNIRGLKQLGISIDAQLVKQTALRLGYGHITNATLKNRLATDALAIAKARLADAESKYGSNTTQVTAARDNLAKAESKVTAGLKETLGALTPAERATVIYTIATKHLSDFQKQAAAHANDYANVQRRLSAEWDHAKELLGKALLPTMTKYTNHLAIWLEKMVSSGKLQKDVNKLVRDAVGIFEALAGVVKIAYRVFQTLVDAVGGARHAFIIFFTVVSVAKFAAITNAIIKGLVGIGLKTLGVAVGEEAAAYVAAFGRMELATLGLQSTILGLLGPIGLAVAAFAGLAYASRDHSAPPGYHYVPTGPRTPPKLVRDSITGVNAADQKGGARGIGGTVRTSGNADFVDESPTLKRALTMLAKRFGDITLASGFRSQSSQDKLWDASVAAGHQGFMPNGNPIARPANRGGTGSLHTAGLAADGMIRYKGKWIPLSSLPPSILAAYGLSTVAGDVGHVQIGSGSSSFFPSIPSPVDPLTGLTVGSLAKKSLTGAQIDAAKRALQNSYKSIKAAASDLGSDLTKKIKKDMLEAQKEIGNVSSVKTIDTARQKLTDLRTEVTAQLKLMRIHISQNNAFESLKRDASKLGSETTPAIAAAMKKIRSELGKLVTPQGQALIHNQMANVRKLIAAQVQLIKAQVSDMQSTFANAWSRIANGADSAFDKATNKALAAMQVMVNAAGSSFLFGGSVTQTPAEIALASLQASHQATIDAKSLADAQANLATAQTSLSDLMNPTTATLDAAQVDYNKLVAQLQVAQDKLDQMQAGPAASTGAFGFTPTGTSHGAAAAGATPAQIALQQAQLAELQQNVDTAQQKLTDLLAPTADTVATAKQKIVDAQAALDDVLYNSKITELQERAQLERDAANQQLTDAQTAYATQRELLKTAMDDRIAAIEKGMSDGSIAADAGMKQLTAVLGDPQYGLDIYNSGLVIGGQLYSGLSAGLAPVFDMLNKLLALMKRAGIVLPGAAAGGGIALTASQALSAANAADPEAMTKALQAANKEIVDELKKQTELMPAGMVTIRGGGGSVSAEVMAAIR